MKKILAIFLLISFISVQNVAYSALAIRMNDDGTYEVYDDELDDYQQAVEVKQEVVITQPTVTQPMVAQPVVTQQVQQKTAQELEDEQDFLKYQNYEKSTSTPTTTSKKTTTPATTTKTTTTPKKQSVGSKIVEGVGTAVIGAGVVLGALASLWWDSLGEDEDEEKEEYCSKCKTYHKKH